MATQQAADTEPNLTECAVCHDLFTVPKLLPCSHVLCRDCLVTWLQSQPQAGCPLCRCAIVDPIQHKGRSVEEVADGFPTDLAMTAMVEAETLLSKQHVCCVCVDVAAVALCLQCGDMFCQHCSNLHKKQSATKHHEVEQLSSLTTEKLAAHHPATCPDHEDEVSKVYCTSHDASLFVLCATTTHNNCSDKITLSTKIGELTTELFQLDDKLSAAVTHSDNIIHTLDKHVQELERDSQSALVELKNVCDRLKAAIDACFLSVKKETLDFVNTIKTKVTDYKKCVVQTRSKIVTQKKMTELYGKFTDHKYFKDMVAMVKGRSNEIVTVQDLPDNLQLNHKLIMSIDPQTVADIERNLSRLGDRMFTPKQSQAPSTKTTAQDKDTVWEQRLPGQILRFDPMTATPTKDITIETHSQQDQSGTCITCLVNAQSAEELYMTDYNNKSIKVCSLKSGHLISTLSLDVTPLRMTLVNDNLLAVTATEHFILLIDINNSKTRVQKKIATTRQYWGITVDRSRSHDPMLVVSSSQTSGDPASVDIITLTGKHVRTVVSTRTLPGLKDPEYLHADTQRDVLYISDYDSDCVFCVQLSTGRLLSELKHPKLLCSRQVCTDSVGNMYVASYWGGCVLVRSVGGEWRVLVTAREHGEGDNDWARGISITSTALIVSCGISITSTALIVSWGISITSTALIVSWGTGGVKRYLLSS